MEAQYFEKEARTENPIIKILMIVGIVFLAVLTIYTFFAIQNTSKQTKYLGSSSGNNTINVSETGISTTAPEYVALVKFTAITEETTIDAALNKNDVKINGITDYLTRQYVNKEDMRIVDFNIYPQYEWQTKGIDLTVYPLGKRVIVGYQVVKSIEVKMTNKEQIGNNIQGSLTSGASQVSGLTFIISNEEALKAEARERAITSAQEKAKKIADGLKVGLGKTVGFTESYSSPVYNSTGTATSGSGSNMQIIVGENKIQVTVNVSYEIK
jgi:hypothetical protein